MTLEFNDFEQRLKQFQVETDAAYFHGVLSGLVCASVEDSEIDNWLPVLLSSHRFVDETDYQQMVDTALSTLENVRDELNEDGFGYSVLLPDDDCALDKRIQSMESWCRGYLVALIEYAAIDVDSLPEECADFIVDVTQFTELETDDDCNVEELEEAFVHLEEYLKVGVHMMYESLNPVAL